MAYFFTCFSAEKRQQINFIHQNFSSLSVFKSFWILYPSVENNYILLYYQILILKKKLSHKLYNITAFFVLARNLFLSSYFEYVMFWSLRIPTKEVYTHLNMYSNLTFKTFFMILLKYPLHTIHHALQQMWCPKIIKTMLLSKHLKTNGLSFACSLVVSLCFAQRVNFFWIKNCTKRTLFSNILVKYFNQLFGYDSVNMCSLQQTPYFFHGILPNFIEQKTKKMRFGTKIKIFYMAGGICSIKSIHILIS